MAERSVIQIDAFKVFASEELYTHNSEDEPEDETDEQHIEDRRDGLH